MGDGVVTKAEFHNTLRILLGIDGDEFVTAVYGRQASDDVAHHRGGHVWLDWVKFRDNPWAWFIQASDARRDDAFGASFDFREAGRLRA